MDIVLHLIKRMLLAKFGWYWSRSSGEDFKFRHWFFAISSLFLLRKGCDLAFEITKWIPFTQGWFVPSLVAMVKYFWRRWNCEKLVDGWQAIRKAQVIQKDNLWRCTEAMMRNDNLRARWSSVPWFAMIPCKFYKVYTPQPESALDALSAVSSMKYLKKILRMSMCVYIKDRQIRKGKIIHINYQLWKKLYVELLIFVIKTLVKYHQLKHEGS